MRMVDACDYESKNRTERLTGSTNVAGPVIMWKRNLKLSKFLGINRHHRHHHLIVGAMISNIFLYIIFLSREAVNLVWLSNVDGLKLTNLSMDDSCCFKMKIVEMCKQTKSLHAFNDFNSQMHAHLRQRTQSMFTTGDLRLIHLQQETSFLRASGEQWMYYSQQKSSPRWTFALLQLCRALAEKCCAQSFHHRQSLALVPTPALNQGFFRDALLRYKPRKNARVGWKKKKLFWNTWIRT